MNKALNLAFGLVIAALFFLHERPVQVFANLQLAQGLTFNSWRPYNNPNTLITVGMNKGEVLAIAGKPDREESYYQSGGGRLVRISDWYYIRTGQNAETPTALFLAETLSDNDVLPQILKK